MTTELQTSGNQYLDLIREVVAKPEVPTEKIKALMDMQLLLEDRQAERLFKAAMSKARKQIKALAWDKKGDNNRYVSYPKIEKMLEPIRDEHGFTQTFDTEISAVPGQMIFCCDLSHDGGFTKRYRLPMSIDGQGPKGGGVMTGAQAVGNGTSYAMRYLQKMIWNIPMLVDKDDNDGNPPYEAINETQAADLRALADEVKKEGETSADVIKAFCTYMKIDTLENLPVKSYKTAVAAFEKRRTAEPAKKEKK